MICIREQHGLTVVEFALVVQAGGGIAQPGE
jgi:hypothetical protein